MKLSAAFSITRGDVVAFIGAGGKTSTLVNLGYELADQGWRVLATTTTRIGSDQLQLFPQAIHPSVGAAALSQALSDHRFVFVYSDVRGEKVRGVRLDEVAWLLDSVDADVLLIEADGACGLPFKAPYEHEPVIPPETSLVVPVASLSVLGQPLDDDHVYNPAAMIDRYGFRHGNAVKSPWLAQVLRDAELGLRGVPDKSRVVVYLNQTPCNGYQRGRARLIARLILRSPRAAGVALGSVRSDPPVCEVQRHVGAVVLAAGMARRMGQSKVLLPWADEQTIVEHIIDQLFLARMDHITVVTGHRAREVGALAAQKDVQVTYNPRYNTGEMLSSLKAGLSALPKHVTAALVVLGDQPRIQPRTINQVMMAYAEGAGRIVAPVYRGQRGHPILIDRRYWQEIMNLPDDGAPRDVIKAHAADVALVEVETDSILADVDTPEQYRDQRRQAGLSDRDASQGQV
jgi:molybdenum cofactor cytidylyltransferase